MRKEIKLQKNFIVPRIVNHRDFCLDVLSPHYNQMDYEAWNSSLLNLKGIFGPNNHWPEEVTGINHNLRDLKKHEDEFNERIAFAYTILSVDKEVCIGCLYLTPMKSSEYNCRVDFWFRDSHLTLEDNFITWLEDWLTRVWGISKPCFPGRKLSWDEYLGLK
jgi:hypothetical protein